MPIYAYRCTEGHEFDRFLKLEDYKEPQVCECGGKAEKLIVPTMLNCDIAPWDAYVSPASGKLITSYKERDRDMKATGCVDYDPGLKKVQKDSVTQADKAIDDAVDKTVEIEFDKMPAHKRERLANELVSHDIEYTRK